MILHVKEERTNSLSLDNRDNGVEAIMNKQQTIIAFTKRGSLSVLVEKPYRLKPASKGRLKISTTRYYLKRVMGQIELC